MYIVQIIIIIIFTMYAVKSSYLSLESCVGLAYVFAKCSTFAAMGRIHAVTN